jgi:hypothetical protein
LHVYAGTCTHAKGIKTEQTTLTKIVKVTRIGSLWLGAFVGFLITAALALFFPFFGHLIGGSSAA